MRLESLKLSAEHMHVVKETLRGMKIVDEIVNEINQLVFLRYEKIGMKDIRETTYEFHNMEWCLRTGMFNGKREYCIVPNTPRMGNHAPEVNSVSDENRLEGGK